MEKKRKPFIIKIVSPYCDGCYADCEKAYARLAVGVYYVAVQRPLIITFFHSKLSTSFLVTILFGANFPVKV